MFQRVIAELVGALVKLRIPRPKYELLSDLTNESVIGDKNELSIKEIKEPKEIYSKFTFAAIDAASVTLHVGFGELSLAMATYVDRNKLIIYPKLRDNVSIEVPVVSSYLKIESIDWITDKYLKLGIKYVNDPELPEGALAHDVRISLETYVMSKVYSRNEPPKVLIVDGPIEYPYRHPLEQSLWNDEIRRLNRDRVKVFKDLISRGVVPVAVVKRVWNSKTQIPGVDDVYTIVRKVINSGMINKPVLIGPITSWTSFSDRKYVYYISIPLTTYLGSITLLRIELLEDAVNKFNYIDEVLSYVAYSSLRAGLPVPYILHQADRVSKRITSSIAKSISALLKVKGIPMFYGGVVIEWE